jgi:diadenylate cyclase
MTEWLAELLRRPTLTWWDALDIALVSVLIYELLTFIRGTRAVQMALGGGFLIGLFFLSRWLELETINWVLRTLGSTAIFAIIVPGRTSASASHFAVRHSSAYRQRVERGRTVEEPSSRHNLSTRRIGAIIVER